VATPASVASDATVEQYADVKGELRVPNTVNFGLFPTLDPFAKAIYYHLFLLSHGFKRDTCIIGLTKLAKSLLMSQRKVQDTILYLEKRHLIKRVASILGGPLKGNVYQVMVPATVAQTMKLCSCLPSQFSRKQPISVDSRLVKLNASFKLKMNTFQSRGASGQNPTAWRT
jgi:hypothetical protein